ncbi:MAG: TOBE-like domain-containing protein, partial [Actinobacteria bacterium]|nr:TOBE-like domain-containing protein [Actinomycetota bacterium]
VNPFVMSFLGQVTTLNGRLVRPHDIEVFTAPVPDALPSRVTRLQRVGFEVRAELGDSGAWAQLTRGQSEALRLDEGTEVWLRPAPNSTNLVAEAPA